MKLNRFWVESRDDTGIERIVAHGKDEKTGEAYYEFLTRASANKLLKEEQKASPNYKYRVVRKVVQIFKTNWE